MVESLQRILSVRPSSHELLIRTDQHCFAGCRVQGVRESDYSTPGMWTEACTSVRLCTLYSYSYVRTYGRTDVGSYGKIGAGIPWRHRAEEDAQGRGGSGRCAVPCCLISYA
jgi:hypothetical protein